MPICENNNTNNGNQILDIDINPDGQFMLLLIIAKFREGPNGKVQENSIGGAGLFLIPLGTP